MSIRLISRVFDMDLPPGQKWVLVAICDCASDEGVCYPGQEKIAKKTGLKLRAVQGHIKWLEAHGLLTRRRRQSSNSRQSDCYQIDLGGYCEHADSAPAESEHAKSAHAHSAHANSAHAKSAPPNMQKTTCEHADSAPSYKEEPSVNRQIEPSGYGTGGAGAPPGADETDFSLPAKAKPGSAKPRDEPNPDNVACWKAYALAYKARYGGYPQPNAQTRGQTASLVRKVGADVAPALAAYYVSHADAYFVRERHPIGLLLKSYQRVLTDMRMGEQMTAGRARQAEQRQNNFESAKGALAILKAQGVA